MVTAFFPTQEVSSGNLILFRLLRLMRLLRLVKLLQVLRRFRREDGTNPGVSGNLPANAALTFHSEMARNLWLMVQGLVESVSTLNWVILMLLAQHCQVLAAMEMTPDDTRTSP